MPTCQRITVEKRKWRIKGMEIHIYRTREVREMITIQNEREIRHHIEEDTKKTVQWGDLTMGKIDAMRTKVKAE